MSEQRGPAHSSGRGGGDGGQGTLFVSIVAQDQYVDGQSLIYGSRALSFVGGPSLGGVLVQALSAPLAITANALSFLGSAFFLGRIRPAEPPADSGSRCCCPRRCRGTG